MLGFILGKKLNQTQMFDTAGKRIPVTHVNTASCYVVDIRTLEKEGYMSVVLGFETIKKQNKPTTGKLKKAGIETPLRFFKEVTIKNTDGVELIEQDGKKGIKIGEKQYMIGEELKASELFKEGDVIDVSGTSKGKGFQGVVKRHNFRGGPRTHGQSDRERAPGSIGQRQTPGRVFKGMRMAGRMGGDRITIKNLQVVAINDGEMVIKGLVPGFTNGLLEVKLRRI